MANETIDKSTQNLLGKFALEFGLIGSSLKRALPSDDGVSSQWHIQDAGGFDINVVDVWDDYTGAGVNLAVIDDGFDHAHADLAPTYDLVADFDLPNNDNDAAPSFTDDNHGTATSGIAAAAANGTGVVGVAYGANLIGYRVDASASAPIGSFMKEVGDAIARAENNADVYSLSLGVPTALTDNFKSGTFDAILLGFDVKGAARDGRGDLGTVGVVAAGNGQLTGDNVNHHNLINSIYTIAVGATDDTGVIADFSSRGAAVNVVAPGVGIYTTDRSGAAGFDAGDFTSLNGTSFATPMVAGIVALMLEANPNLGIRDVQEILQYSAIQTDPGFADWNFNGAGNWNGGGLHFSHAYGFGLVDALAAVRMAEVWVEQSVFSPFLSGSRGVDDVNFSNSTSQTISSGAPSTITSTINTSYAQDFEIDHIVVELDIQHTYIDDLRVVLTSPSGLESILLDFPVTESGQENFNGRFETTTLQHWGEDISGTWTLSVEDGFSGDGGVLNGWNITFYGDDDDGDNTYVYTDEYAGVAGIGSRNTLTDTGGNDNINAAALTGAVTLDLAAGSTNTLAGQTLNIAAGTIIEQAFTGDGDDTVTANASANVIKTGRGNDTIIDVSGDDIYDGGAGIDSVSYASAAAAVNVYLQFTGIDTGGAGIDTLTGIENLTGSAFADRLNGNSGDNILIGNDGNDIMKGKGGNDTFHGGGGDDKLTGSAGDDIMFGGSGNDILFALAGFDQLNGGDDRDFLYGGRDNDTLNGDAGNDELRGNLGNDILEGGAGIDDLRGGGQNDILNGGADVDYLFGENGNDTLNGGLGNDSMTGGAGIDTFIFANTGSGFDRVKDFENGTDKIDLTSFGFTDFNADVASLASDTASGLKINFGGGEVLLLENFLLADFDAGDVLL